MTLQEFFNFINANPQYASYYFIGIPILALVISWISEPYCYTEPWKYLYSIIIYAICIPGIFAVTLNIYFFFWERRSIMDAELMLQFVPILSMIATLWIIHRYLSFEAIPGFDKLSGLITIIGIILTLMWILDRTYIFVFTRLPFAVVLGLVIGGILMIRMAFRRMIN